MANLHKMRFRKNTLILKNCEINDDDANNLLEVFSESKDKFKEITTLAVGCNQLTARGAAILANIPSISNITTIIINNNMLGDEGAKLLLTIPTLIALNLSNNNLTDNAFETISPSIQSLNVSCNKLTDYAALKIAELPQLTHLTIECNKLGNLGAMAILEKRKQLAHLNIAENDIDNLAMTKFKENKTIKALNLNRNLFDNHGLVELLKNNSISTLGISHNNIKMNTELLVSIYNNPRLTRFYSANILKTKSDDPLINAFTNNNKVSDAPFRYSDQAATFIAGAKEEQPDNCYIKTLPAELILKIATEAGDNTLENRYRARICLFLMDVFGIRPRNEYASARLFQANNKLVLSKPKVNTQNPTKHTWF